MKRMSFYEQKRAIKRGLKIELLEQVVALLAMGEPQIGRASCRERV